MNSKQNEELADARKQLEQAIRDYRTAAGSAAGEERLIPMADIQTIMDLLTEAEDIFSSYAHPLTPVERRRLNGTSYKRYGFIAQCFAYVQQHPDLKPSYLKLDDDFRDYERIRGVYEYLQQFESVVYDAMLYASNEAYNGALAYYSYIREAARQHVPGAEAIYHSLKAFFASHGAHATAGEPTEEQIERDVKSLLHGTKEGKIVIENEIPVQEKARREVFDSVHKPDRAIDETVIKNEEEN
jgi:hypothetical protein